VQKSSYMLVLCNKKTTANLQQST